MTSRGAAWKIFSTSGTHILRVEDARKETKVVPNKRRLLLLVYWVIIFGYFLMVWLVYSCTWTNFWNLSMSHDTKSLKNNKKKVKFLYLIGSGYNIYFLQDSGKTLEKPMKFQSLSSCNQFVDHESNKTELTNMQLGSHECLHLRFGLD